MNLPSTYRTQMLSRETEWEGSTPTERLSRGFVAVSRTRENRTVSQYPVPMVTKKSGDPFPGEQRKTPPSMSGTQKGQNIFDYLDSVTFAQACASHLLLLSIDLLTAGKSNTPFLPLAKWQISRESYAPQSCSVRKSYTPRYDAIWHSTPYEPAPRYQKHF